MKNYWGKNKNALYEAISLLSCIILFIVGIASDCLVGHGNVLHEVTDINTFSLTLLQIQASVSTLSIALVALISGNITESYMGVPICHYYMNIKPRIFKQKIIIFLSLITLIVNVIFHLWECYNLVICLFAISAVLIFISITELYSIFRGKNNIHKEIEKFLHDVISGNYEYEYKYSIMENYINDWKNIIGSQMIEEYEQYFKLFNELNKTILLSKSENNIKDSEQACYKIAYSLLTAENVNSRARGISFIQDIYEQMWSFVSDKNFDISNKHLKEFSLFNELSLIFYKAIRIMPISLVEQTLRWDYLSDNIIRVAYCLMKNNNSNDRSSLSEVKSCNEFSRYIGNYLYQNREESTRPRVDYWGGFLKRLYLSETYGVPDKYKEEFLRSKCMCYFNYCYGLINNGFIDIVRDTVYLDAMNSIYRTLCRNEVLFYLLLESYLYYLGEIESISCISQDIQHGVKEFVKGDIHKTNFYNYLYVLSENVELLDDRFRDDVYEVLEWYELFPKHSNSKTMIMDRAVDEFYVYLILYIENEFYIPDIYKIALGKNEKILGYNNRFLGISEEKSKDNFKHFYQMLDVQGKDEEQINNDVEQIFDKLISYIIANYKEYIILEAEKAQKAYKEIIDEENLALKINKTMEKHLKDTFEPIISGPVESEIIKLHLFKGEYPTSMIDEQCVNQFYSQIVTKIIENICGVLKQRNVVQSVDRSAFTDDNEYITFLESTDTKILMGSEFALKNLKQLYAKEFRDFSEECSHIYCGYLKYGLSLKSDSIKLCINKVNASIHSPSFREIEAEYDANEEKYRHEIGYGKYAYFTRNELENFIHNKSKIVDIVAWISIETRGDHIGSIISR